MGYFIDTVILWGVVSVGIIAAIGVDDISLATMVSVNIGEDEW